MSTEQNMYTEAATAVVVNDEPIQLEVLAEMLHKLGLEVETFESAEKALSAMDGAVPPDLIVTDLHMPGIDGWRFCRLLRSPEYPGFNTTPILVVSATFAGDEVSRITADLGANAFLSAPLDSKHFAEQIQALLRGDQAKDHLRVLIVEDSEIQAHLIAKAFTAAGINADTAFTAQEAITAFSSTAYDVAVLDHHLPDGTGGELLTRFRKERLTCTCIMMTIDPAQELALEWMKQGAAAYLRKPFEPAYLIELCARARREQALLRVEDLLEKRTRELRDSVQKHKRLVSNLTETYLYRHDANGVFSYVSPSVTQVLGYTPEEFLKYSSKYMTDHPVNQVAHEHTTLSIRGIPQPPYEVELMDKKGELHWLEVSEAPVCDTSGAVVAVEGVAHDITKRKLVEEKLRAVGEMQELIINNIPQAVFWKNSQSVYLGCNKAFANTLGLDDPRDIIGNTDYDHSVTKEQADFYRKCDRQVMDTDTPQLKIEESMRGPNEQELWLITNKVPLHDKNGSVMGILGTFADISERKKAEAAREILEAQLRQAQKMEAIGQLTGGIAHDFNNLLQVILGYGDLALEDAESNQPTRSSIEEILEAGHRAKTLVRHLLAFSRQQVLEMKDINLNEVIADLMKMIRRVIGEHITLDVLTGHNLGIVRADPGQLEQILVNLCVNARDAMPGGGRITIETENVRIDEDYCLTHTWAKPGRYVLLSITDTGCGMDQSTMANVFEPFFTTKEVGVGTGLGLSTVYGLVKQHEGMVHVYSEVDKGSIFKIYLPLVERSATSVGARIEGSVPHGTETILLAEDDKTVRELAKVMLERGGYTVLTAADGEDALRVYENNTDSIDLVLLDVIMPKLGGKAVFERIREDHPDLHFLFASGYNMNAIHTDFVLDEGMALVQKPYQRDTLLRKVREILDRD